MSKSALTTIFIVVGVMLTYWMWRSSNVPTVFDWVLLRTAWLAMVGLIGVALYVLWA